MNATYYFLISLKHPSTPLPTLTHRGLKHFTSPPPSFLAPPSSQIMNTRSVDFSSNRWHKLFSKFRGSQIKRNNISMKTIWYIFQRNTDFIQTTNLKIKDNFRGTRANVAFFLITVLSLMTISKSYKAVTLFHILISCFFFKKKLIWTFLRNQYKSYILEITDKQVETSGILPGATFKCLHLSVLLDAPVLKIFFFAFV